MKKIDAIKAFEEYKIDKKNIIENNLKLKGIKKAKFYFPITQLLLKAITILNKEKIYYLNDVKIPKDKTLLFACTHKFKPDIEKISQANNVSSIMVASDFVNSYKTINGWYFNTRPTIFVDPYSKEDKKYTSKMIVRYLKEGNNCMIFPEAVWNLSPNKIVLKTFTGTVRASLETNSPIVCTAIERYGKNYIINRNYFNPTDYLKKYTNKTFEQINSDLELRKIIIDECNIALRDNLATLTYEIWDEFAKKNGLVKRNTLKENYWVDFIKELTSEWQGYKLSDNIEQQFPDKKELEQIEIEQDINNIKNNLNINNLFLFTTNERYEKAKQLIKRM